MNEDIRWIVGMLREVALPTGTRWFVFGSVLDGGTGASDIDLLVLYREECQAKKIRDAVSVLGRERPIDLLLVTYQEEEELGFRERQECVELLP